MSIIRTKAASSEEEILVEVLVVKGCNGRSISGTVSNEDHIRVGLEEDLRS